MRRRKLRIVRIIITEIAIMSLGVLCCIMPMPWRLVVPIIIGTRSILIKAHMRLKESPLTEEMQSVPPKGNNENGKTRAKSKTENKSKKDSKKAVRKDDKKAKES